MNINIVQKNTKMKTFKRPLLIKLLLILLLGSVIQSYTESGRLSSRELSEKVWSFSNKDTLSLETMGNTKVYISESGSGQIEIRVRYIDRPDEKFEVKEKQRTLYLKEIILNYDRQRPTQTYFEECTWIITVPQGMYIKCNGSSSDYKVRGFNGFFKADYGSGSFVFDNVDGNVEMSMGSLFSKIHNSKGTFNLSSAIGSIRATDLTITGNSNFTSGMGSIKISLARMPAADLYVCSSFNKAKVNFNGHPVAGYFEFIARADKGRIKSPFKFDNEETFLDDIKGYNNSSDFGKKADYHRKSITMGVSNPKITLKTVTGIAQLIK